MIKVNGPTNNQLKVAYSQDFWVVSDIGHDPGLHQAMQQDESCHGMIHFFGLEDGACCCC